MSNIIMRKFKSCFFYPILVGGLLLPTSSFSQENKILLSHRAIEVIEKKEGVYLYSYPETIEEINPKKDFIKKYRIHNRNIIEKLNQLILSNKEYDPIFKAKCLPIWDYGLEFRSKEESYMFLFSFRCNTIKYVNENLFKDFSPQSTEFYKIFKYEIDDKNSLLIEEKID